MPRTFAVFTLIGLAAVAPALAAPHGAVPPESFLNYHAATVQELSQEVTLDPAVRNRLAHHFHVTPKQMTTYVRRNLVLTHLKSTGTYRVACVRADGSEYWVHERLPAGTPIFASRATGKPILKLACGNPMVSALPPSVKISDNKALHTPPALALLPSTLQMPEAPPLLAGEIAPQFAFTTDVLTVPPVVEVAGSLQSIVPVRGGGGFPLGYLAGIPILAGLIGHGGGSGGSSFVPSVPPVTPVTPVTPIIPGSPPVPEASTVASLGLLLGTLGVLALRRKRPAPNQSQD